MYRWNRIFAVLIILIFSGVIAKTCCSEMVSKKGSHWRKESQCYRELRNRQPAWHWKDDKIPGSMVHEDGLVSRKNQEPGLSAEWQSLGPAGGNIISLAIHPHDPQILYAVADVHPCRIYKTTNGGTGWQICNSTAIDDYPTDIAIDADDPDNLYLSCQSELIYKSTNRGYTWTGYSTNGDDNWIYALTVDPCNPSIIWGAADCYDNYSGSFHFAVARSTNGGSHWTFTSLGESGSWGGAAYCIALDPATCDIYVGGVYADDYGYSRPRLLRSIDGGSHWIEIDPDLTGRDITGSVITLAVNPINENIVYVGGFFSDRSSEDEYYLLKTADSGSNWTDAGAGISNVVYCLTIDPTSTNILYSGTYDQGIYKSVNSGASWNPAANGVRGRYIWDMLIAPPSSASLFASSNAGIFKTSDGGANWVDSHDGIIATAISAVVVAPSSPNVLYIGVDNDALYKSDDYGTSWIRLREFYGCHGVTSLVVDPKNALKIFLFTGG
jgi:photosystem II stability/assembly factor-like uncharacterized protein